MALVQVRVHYKIVTTRTAETRDNGAKVTVYLDGAMTNDDLQQLTDEFYAVLQRKLGALGIERLAIEYYTKAVEARSDESELYKCVRLVQTFIRIVRHQSPQSQAN